MNRIILLMIVLMQASCAGGTIGNLLPAPKMLGGDVKDSVYYSERGSFSVLTPFPEGSYDYTYMEVNEGGEGKWENVAFNSSTKPRNIYRVEVGLADPGDVDGGSGEYLESSMEHLAERYASNDVTDFERVATGELQVDGEQMVFGISRYTAPPRFSLAALSSSKPYTAWLLMIVDANPEGVLYLSFDFAGDCEPCLSGDMPAIRADNPGIDRMIASVQVNWDARAE